MARIYVQNVQLESGMIRLIGREARYLRNVLRLDAGDTFSIFDGTGRQYDALIMETKPGSVVASISKAYLSGRDPEFMIALGQSMLKGEKMDFVVQKATEIGITKFIPFLSSRSIPMPVENKRLQRVKRWEKIAAEASRQCGRGTVPVIAPLQEYHALLKAAPQDLLRIILWEEEGIYLKSALEKAGNVKGVLVLVGPEGGWTREEIQKASENGFATVTLGRRILRAETAALYVVSVIHYEFGESKK